MARRIKPRSTLAENLRVVGKLTPWRLLLLIPLLLAFAIPAFLLGTNAGRHILPNLTNFFYDLGNSTPTVIPTPHPPLTQVLPQPGAIAYTVHEGDSCDAILATQMRMSDAGQIFSDANPSTIKALNTALGQNCGNLQPGDVITLMPQYPLVTFGGIILKVDALSPAQPIPTPLIRVKREQQVGVDCSNGCQLTVQVAPNVEVKFSAETVIPVQIGSWIWAQAMYPRKTVAGFGNYPYPDPAAQLNGATLQVCDLQINDTHDDTASTCDELRPNTISDDGGAWVYGVTGSGALDHWKYNLNLPPGTRVLLWLSADSNGHLHYRKGNATFRYDATLHLYVHL